MIAKAGNLPEPEDLDFAFPTSPDIFAMMFQSCPYTSSLVWLALSDLHWPGLCSLRAMKFAV